MALPVVQGTGGDDANLSASTASVIYGYSGDDVIHGSSGDDYIHGGQYTWRVVNGSPNWQNVGDDDVINGGAGNDWIFMGGGNDTVNGGAGIDNADFSGAYSSFMVEVEPGHYGASAGYLRNLVVNLSGTYSGDFVTAHITVHVAGALLSIERVTGTAFDDVLIGTSADESFRPLQGNDDIQGGGGIDILRYDHAQFGITDAHGVNVDFTLGKVNDTAGNIDTFSGIEHVIGSGHFDKFTGDSGAQTFTGGDGGDEFDGGGGIDTVDYGFEEGTKGILLSMAATGTGYDTYGKIDSFKEIENIKGTARNDTIQGDSKANEIWGRSGNDTLRGEGGNDNIRGDSDPALKTGGNDTILGGAGNDKINGCAGDDRIDGGIGNDDLNGGYGVDTFYSSGVRGSPWTINLTTGKATYGRETDKLSNFENAVGNRGDDTIIGNKGVNKLEGGDGNDLIAGGLGLDKLYGDSGVDTVDYGASTLAVTANLGTGRATFKGVTGSEIILSFENIFGGKADDSLTGSAGVNVIVGGGGNDKIFGLGGNDDLDGGGGNDFIEGGNGNDFLGGGGGADKLLGGVGADSLSGGAGKDTLTGDAGRDIFYFNSVKDSLVGSSRDTIADFRKSEKDRIGLEGIDANTTVKDDQDFTFVGTAAFSKKAGELRFDKGIVAGDVNGDGKADFEIAVSNVASLVKTDFFL